MSTTAKTGVVLVIILAILVVIWAWRNDSSPSNTVIENNNTATTTPTASKFEEMGMSAENNSSTEALQKDTAAIDNQLKDLGTDSADIDQNLESTK